MLKHTYGRVIVATSFAIGSIGAAVASASSEPPVPSVPSVPGSAAPPSSGPVAPSTTVDPGAALDATISEAAVEAAAAARGALFNPDDPAALAALDQWYVAGSPARARVDRLVHERSGAARVLQPHPSIVDSTVVEDVIAGAGPSPTRAGVVVCAVEASQEVSPTGEQLAQDLTSRRDVYEMNLVGGRWQLLTSSNLQTWSSQTECAPATPEIVQAGEITVRISEIDTVQLRVTTNPDEPGADELLRSVLTEHGDAITGTRGFIQSLRESGQQLRSEPGRPSSVSVEQLTPVDGAPPTRIDAIVCGVDATMIVEPGGGPDGQDSIVNDLISANRVVFHLVVEDGSWQLDMVDSVGRWTDVVECPAA